ncbi:MAG: nitroreductase family protein [Leucobacter sp.]
MTDAESGAGPETGTGAETAAGTGSGGGSKSGAYEALLVRRSHSKVTDAAPDRAELERLLQAMASVADHSALRPWRIVELRGAARERLGRALAKANGTKRSQGIAKATRAPLVLAVVVSPRKGKIPAWEQEAVASGVAHYLGLLLHEAGWGSIWRTGSAARSKPVRKALRLAKHEYALGWLYVGGIPERDRGRDPKRRKPIDLERHLGTLEG